MVFFKMLHIFFLPNSILSMHFYPRLIKLDPKWVGYFNNEIIQMINKLIFKVFFNVLFFSGAKIWLLSVKIIGKYLPYE